MTKYNQSFKQQVIEFYLQNGKNHSLTRQHFQLARTTLERWIIQYNHNGINGLAVLGKKQTYSPEFKLSVVQAVKNGQFSAEEACLYFGIANSGSISQWLQTFDKQGINGLLPKPKGRP
ncbi:helix-turn-helix domain-containing protein, partial [Mannheimia indoligenes]|uniref:helix-turn-helix domain-containing protein n=1 Tax=Mannheimia indoligenes TaxID=3103145 RepID=UPI002FE5ACDF